MSIKQTGSMLVIALFVIIVLALLGLTITRLLSASSNTIIHEVLGQRALNAARTGIECRVAATFPIPSATNCQNPAGDTFNGIPGLENCGYTATVIPVMVTDGTTRTYYKFSSTGTCSAGNIIVSRTVYIDAMN